MPASTEALDASAAHLADEGRHDGVIVQVAGQPLSGACSRSG